MKKLGRPTKENPNNSGELKSNLCRFTFIAEKSQVENIKCLAESRKISVKQLMFEILSYVTGIGNVPIKSKKVSPKVKNEKSKVEIRNEEMLKASLASKK
jgi:hypothetical protein